MANASEALSRHPKIAQRLRHERCRFLRQQRVPLEKIAEEVGLSVKHVSRITADLTNRKRRIDVPAWVPNELRLAYVQIGQNRGEHDAAAMCRKMKAQLAEGVKFTHGVTSWSAR